MRQLQARVQPLHEDIRSREEKIQLSEMQVQEGQAAGHSLSDDHIEEKLKPSNVEGHVKHLPRQLLRSHPPDLAGTIRITTRRFLLRPSGVLLVSTGFSEAKLDVVRREGWTPCWTREAFTELARFSAMTLL